MMKLFSTEEVNTGRQKEFDLLKGIFMIFIFLLNAFRMTLSGMTGAVRGILIFATMSGAAIYLFAMGFVMAYGKRTKPKELAGRGLRLILYQYLVNLVYIAVLVFPYPLVMNRLTGAGAENLRKLIWVHFQYIDIFFAAGLFYLLLALLKKGRSREWAYPLLGVFFALIAPLLQGKSFDIPVLSYVLKVIAGEASFVSVIPLYYVSYALIGAGAGYLYRHIKDRRRFYLAALPVCGVFAAAWWIRVFLLYGSDPELMAAVMEEGYAHPDILHVIASLAHVLLFAGILFFLTDRKREEEKRENPVETGIMRYAGHISEYYALHITVYFAALSFHGYIGFEPLQCFLLMLLSMVLTELMVRTGERLESKREKKIENRAILIYAAPYWFMMFLLIFRVYQLNHSRTFLSPQQFEMVSWWGFVVMIAAAQILFVRNKKMAEEKAREQALLDTAKEIQDGIVPRNKEFAAGNIRISAFAQPAKSVGGDFYDIVPFPDGRVGIVMGDVSGKGIPAALFMSMVKTMIRDRLMTGLSPEEVLCRVNDEVCAENPKGMFATVFAGVMDPETGELVYANAGHTFPVMTGESAAFLEPDCGCAIGLFEDVEILRDTMVIKPGEGLLLYTDGTTEAVNRAKEQYGEERLLKICSQTASGDLVRTVAEDVLQFSSGLTQFDDLTLLAVQHLKA